MPRKPDPHVEIRILDAAEKLLHPGGERAISMRKVANLAKTNTPAVYRRFRDKEEILRALVRRYQQAFFATIQDCASLPEVADRALEFAVSRPREYEVLTSGLLPRLSERRPNIEFLMKRSAEWLGGNPEDHTALVIALWSLMHGTAMLSISGTFRPQYGVELRSVYGAAVKVLVSQAGSLSTLSHLNGQR
jgi:AcrR family transcriptional regulator